MKFDIPTILWLFFSYCGASALPKENIPCDDETEADRLL